jgi:hypothetical protein
VNHRATTLSNVRQNCGGFVEDSTCERKNTAVSFRLAREILSRKMRRIRASPASKFYRIRNSLATRIARRGEGHRNWKLVTARTEGRRENDGESNRSRRKRRNLHVTEESTFTRNVKRVREKNRVLCLAFSRFSEKLSSLFAERCNDNSCT